MQTALVIPSLGAPLLESCLRAVADLDPPPGDTVLVLSGGAPPPSAAATVRVLENSGRLGFAAAANLGLSALADDVEAVALLNDDAAPPPGWLGVLTSALAGDSTLAAIQGSVTDAGGRRIDGRGIGFDRWGLPIQVDRGTDLAVDEGTAPRCAVSGTACLYRTQSLAQAALGDGKVFDERFDSYLEDLDLGLRMLRLGWRSAWTGGAAVRHLGSATGVRFGWRHPWWLLANRWRALAGNLTPAALVRAVPRLLRGELRAVHTLLRHNLRAAPVGVAVACMLPPLVAAGWRRATPGDRLTSIPGIGS